MAFEMNDLDDKLNKDITNGYHAFTRIEAFSTDPVMDDAPKAYPTLQMQASNLQVAIGIVGMQVARGRFHINLMDDDWSHDFAGRALEIAEFLATLQVPTS